MTTGNNRWLAFEVIIFSFLQEKKWGRDIYVCIWINVVLDMHTSSFFFRPSVRAFVQRGRRLLESINVYGRGIRIAPLYLETKSLILIGYKGDFEECVDTTALHFRRCWMDAFTFRICAANVIQSMKKSEARI